MTRIAIAISTLGRWDAIDTVLGDLAAQTRAPDLVVVRSDAPRPATSARVPLPLEYITSPGGASAGRNAAAEHARGRADYILFLNDTSRIAPDLIARLRSRVTDRDIYALRMIDSEGPRNRLFPGTPLTSRTVWGPIEPSTLLRLDAVLAVGGFDPLLGPGAASPWQCGEITDLLLRMRHNDATTSIEWVPELEVTAMVEFSHLPRIERHRKIRAYGRGSGNIYRSWNYSAAARVRHAIGGAVLFLRNPRKYSVADSWQMFLGRLEGLRGRAFRAETDYRSALR